MALNETLCRNAKLRDKKYKLTDGEGMYLQILPTGTKSWYLKYTFYEKEKRISLCVYPHISLKEARTLSAEKKAEIENGIDPLVKREEEQRLAKYKAAQTLEAVAREWHTFKYSDWIKRYADQILMRLERHIFQELGIILSMN